MSFSHPPISALLFTELRGTTVLQLGQDVLLVEDVLKLEILPFEQLVELGTVPTVTLPELEEASGGKQQRGDCGFSKHFLVLNEHWCYSNMIWPIKNILFNSLPFATKSIKWLIGSPVELA